MIAVLVSLATAWQILQIILRVSSSLCNSFFTVKQNWHFKLCCKLLLVNLSTWLPSWTVMAILLEQCLSAFLLLFLPMKKLSFCPLMHREFSFYILVPWVVSSGSFHKTSLLNWWSAHSSHLLCVCLKNRILTV